MLTLFCREPRITVLVVSLILVAGLSSYVLLPRMEDPLLTERAAMISTIFPGANAERVEALITEKIEDELSEVDEIKEVRSISRSGISLITIELRDDVYEIKADAVWSRVRDRLGDTVPLLPSGALEPEFEILDVKACALIAAVTWDHSTDDQPVPWAILRRVAEQLEDELQSVQGTEKVDTFGDPDEEILVEVDGARIAGLGLTVEDVSQQIRASDAKTSAGQLRGRTDMLVEVRGELDSIDRIARTPVRATTDGRFVTLSEIASVTRTIADPPSSPAIVNGKSGIAVGAMVRPGARVDHWSADADQELQRFAQSLPTGLSLVTVFRQNDYVASRLTELLINLLFGGLAVAMVILVMMGWRSAMIVCTALPLSALMVLTGMRHLGIPIHQMSVHCSDCSPAF